MVATRSRRVRRSASCCHPARWTDLGRPQPHRRPGGTSGGHRLPTLAHARLARVSRQDRPPPLAGRPDGRTGGRICHVTTARPLSTRASRPSEIQKSPAVQGFLDAPERTRTSTDPTVHKALNLARLPIPPQALEAASITPARDTHGPLSGRGQGRGTHLSPVPSPADRGHGEAS
jgi:hypothetical protein